MELTFTSLLQVVSLKLFNWSFNVVLYWSDSIIHSVQFLHPFQAAALALQQEADKWEDENNAIIRVAKTMATQMYEMSRYARRTANSEVSL